MTEESIIYHHDRAQDFEGLYSALQRDYWRSSFSYGRKKIEELLAQTLIAIPPSGRILDIGCGTGEQLRYCRELGFVVTGLEPAASMRAICRQHSPDIPVVDAVATGLPFPDRHFDLVLVIEVMRYLSRDDGMQVYQELARVIKPGGFAFITMVNLYALDGFFFYNAFHRLVRRLRGLAAPIHCEFTTPHQVRTHLKDVGFSQVDCHGRMLGPLRMLYRINAAAGARVARVIERWDDRLSAQPWTVPFAGHLVVVGKR